jgi:hypothetical protein
MEFLMYGNPTLDDRHKKYGSYLTNAQGAQNIKQAFENTERWNDLRPYQKESLQLIATKISRILNGDPDNVDSWHDISGYAQLVEKELNDEDKFQAASAGSNHRGFFEPVHDAVDPGTIFWLADGAAQDLP